MIKSLNQEKLVDFINSLKKDYQVYLPLPAEDPNIQLESNNYLFQKATDYNLHKLNFDHPKPFIPPTTFLLPMKEKIIDIKNDRYFPIKKEAPVLLFGVQAADVTAINRLKKILIKKGGDKFVEEKDENLTLVGIEDTKQADVFDKALNPDELTGYDLFLKPQNDEYLAYSGSEKGDALLNFDVFSKEMKTAQSNKTFEKNKKNAYLNLEKIKWAVEKTKGEKVWKKWAKKCVGCGSCSYVCPLCFCYEITDEIDLNGRIERIREQSSCFLGKFDEIAGNFNPRDNFVQRLYHWYHHKFVQMPEEFGFSGCVNCGRCVKQCPAGINFREVINEAIEEAENG